MKRLLICALLALPLPAAAHDHDHDHAFARNGLHIEHPWLHATDSGPADLFLELETDGPVTLLGAEADWADAGRITTFGTADAQPVPALPVTRIVALRPDEVAIRLTGLKMPLHEGDVVDLTLLTDRGPVPIRAEVMAADARQHSHAGHHH